MLRGELGFGENRVKIAIERLASANRLRSSSKSNSIRFLGDHMVRKIDLATDRSHISLSLVFLVLFGFHSVLCPEHTIQLSVFAGYPREWGDGILAKIDV